MVTTSSFLNAPVSRLLVFGLLSSSLLTSVVEIKHYLPIKPVPHLWPYLQLWRILTFQLASISSTEVFSSLLLLYNFRVLERLWGSRKYASFVVVSWMLCGTLTVALGLVMKVLTLGVWAYIPPGLTAVVVCTLAVWRGEVPRLGGVKLVLDEQEQQRRGGAVQATPELRGFLLSDKFTTYILAAQLSLSQFPYQLLPAFVGWVVGSAWREEMLPYRLMRWRLPGWMVGETGSGKAGRQYEGLRRRLEEEGGSADGMREVSDGVVRGGAARQEERRGFTRTMMGYFGGGSSS